MRKMQINYDQCVTNVIHFRLKNVGVPEMPFWNTLSPGVWTGAPRVYSMSMRSCSFHGSKLWPYEVICRYFPSMYTPLHLRSRLNLEPRAEVRQTYSIANLLYSQEVLCLSCSVAKRLLVKLTPLYTERYYKHYSKTCRYCLWPRKSTNN